MQKCKVGVVGSGTMGIGIAQVAAQSGHQVFLIDSNQNSLEKAQIQIQNTFLKLVEKNKITFSEQNLFQTNLKYSINLNDLKECDFVIEAIVEHLESKHKLFKDLETIVSEKCVLATNTSSLSIASIGSILKNSRRIIGIHFFNPAPLMPLVEIIPAVQTEINILQISKNLIDSWNKTTVVCKDTPGFIVNRVARPFYGEALRIFEEGIADFATIDWAMTHLGGFKMGPFTLMDYIGNDINYTVTETVFEAFYFDPRFKPSFTQKRYKEAGFFGRKSGKGFYDYTENTQNSIANEDPILGKQIFERILVMLINEAFDAVFLKIATKEDIEKAMTKGVNYPKGLIQWAEELGLEYVLDKLNDLFLEYGEDRYRPNVLLKRMVKLSKN